MSPTYAELQARTCHLHKRRCKAVEMGQALKTLKRIREVAEKALASGGGVSEAYDLLSTIRDLTEDENL